MRTCLLVFLFVSGMFAACGSDPSSVASPGDSPADASVDVAEPDGSESHDAASSADGAPILDSGTDAASALVPPSPPAGSTKCGQGNLTSKDIHDACALPTSFGPPPVPSCDAVTTTGGRFEVWCSEASTYVWVEIDALQAAPATMGCPVAAGNFQLDRANYSESFPSGGGAGPATLDAFVSLDTPQTFSVHAIGPAGEKGTMALWLSGLDPSCPFDAGYYGSLVAGAYVSWP